MRHKERIELIKDSIAKLATGLLQTVDIVEYAPETASARLTAAQQSLTVINVDLKHAVHCVLERSAEWGEEE